MDDADKQGAQCVKQTQPRERGTEACGRGYAFTMMFSSGPMGMPMQMDVGIVFVKMRVVASYFGMRWRKFLCEPVHGSGQIQYTKQDEHQADGKFHGQAYANRDGHSEQDYGYTYGDDGDGVAAAPENADESRLGNGALAADDSGDCDDVVGIGCVAHAKQEPDG